MDPWTALVICLIMGGVAAAIGRAKNLPTGQSFALGALLSLIGVIIVICQKPGLPQAPPGMRAVKCLRCNTTQNVPESQRVYECWQCKDSHELWAAPADAAAAQMQPPKPVKSTTKLRCHACQHVQHLLVIEPTFTCDECGAVTKT